MNEPDILTHQIICRKPDRYLAWPCITRTPAGDLLVAFSGDREAHTCPFGKTQLIRSSDDGRTWSDPETINDTPLDDRDAGIVALRDGTLILRWFTLWCPPDHERHKHDHWRDHAASLDAADVERWTGPTNYDADGGKRGHWVRRSTDGGTTWEPPLHVVGTSPKPPYELADGTLLMIGNTGYNRLDRSSEIAIERSADQGRSWDVIARLPMFVEAGYLCEPHLVEAAPGQLVALARFQYKPYNPDRPQYLFQTDSQDGGATWSDWRETALVGYPPHLLRLRDGRLLATYGHRYEPYGQRAAVSADNGVNWREFVLRDDAPNRDLGYPASVELADETVLTVYYQREPNAAQPCLMTTHWRLPT